jgi:hypothetical protein
VLAENDGRNNPKASAGPLVVMGQKQTRAEATGVGFGRGSYECRSLIPRRAVLQAAGATSTSQNSTTLINASRNLTWVHLPSRQKQIACSSLRQAN